MTFRNNSVEKQLLDINEEICDKKRKQKGLYNHRKIKYTSLDFFIYCIKW